MLQRRDVEVEGENREVMEEYRMLENDRGWVSSMEEEVNKGIKEEDEVEKVKREKRERMVNMKEKYMRERIQDLEDIENRIMRKIMGREVKKIEE